MISASYPITGKKFTHSHSAFKGSNYCRTKQEKSWYAHHPVTLQQESWWKEWKRGTVNHLTEILTYDQLSLTLSVSFQKILHSFLPSSSLIAPLFVIHFCTHHSINGSDQMLHQLFPSLIFFPPSKSNVKIIMVPFGQKQRDGREKKLGSCPLQRIISQSVPTWNLSRRMSEKARKKTKGCFSIPSPSDYFFLRKTGSRNVRSMFELKGMKIRENESRTAVLNRDSRQKTLSSSGIAFPFRLLTFFFPLSSFFNSHSSALEFLIQLPYFTIRIC